MNLENKYSTTVKSYVPLTEDEKDYTSKLSESGIPAYKIAEILGKDKRLFLLDYKREGTDVFNAYYKGILLAKSTTNSVILEAAKKGNITAKQQMEKIWSQQETEDMIQEIFNTE